MKLKRKILTALFAAILCVLAPISVSVGAIPVSLGTFCVCVLALLVDRRCVPIAILLYAALGTVGLPVFAGPVEGTAIGNLIVQMIAGGDLSNLQAARDAIRASFEIKEVTP